jgi:hypothetical protein
MPWAAPENLGHFWKRFVPERLAEKRVPMPLFFFDFTSNGIVIPDDVGVSFLSLEEAYLETCRAALDICFENFRSQDDPHRNSFDILDEERRPLMHVPFSEVLRLRPILRPAGSNQVMESCRRQMARSRTLCAEVGSELQKAQSALVTMRINLARLKSL